MSCELTYEEASTAEEFFLIAYYGTPDETVDSALFTLTTPEHAFTVQPMGGTVDPGDTITIIYDYDSFTVTPPAFPDYQVSAWFPCKVVEYTSSEDGSVRYEMYNYYDAAPVSVSGTLHYTISGDSGMSELYFTAVYTPGGSATVDFLSQGGTPVESQQVNSGETLTAPADPVKIGAVFTGWYTARACTEETRFDFSTPVTQDMELYAGWIVPEPNGFLRLPPFLTTIEADAFNGIAAEALILPDSVTAISGNPFAQSAVRYLYGTVQGSGRSFAEAFGLTFVPIDDAWLGAH